MKAEATFRGYQTALLLKNMAGELRLKEEAERGSQKKKQETGDSVKGGVQQRNYSNFQNNIWLLTVLTL